MKNIQKFSSIKYYKFHAFLLFFSFTLYSWVFFYNLLIGRDEGQFLFFAKSIAQGQVLYVDIHTPRSPIPFYLMSLFIWLSNDNLYFVRLLVPLFNFLNALIIYKIGEKHWSLNVGKIASILYILGFTMPLFEEVYLMTEPFELFFGTIGVYFYLNFKKTDYTPQLFLSGIFIGLSILSKQYGILFFILLFSYETLFLLGDRSYERIINFFKINILIFTGILFTFSVFLLFIFATGHYSNVMAVYFGGTTSAAGSLISIPNFLQLFNIILGFSIVYVFALFFSWNAVLNFSYKNDTNFSNFLLMWAVIFSFLIAVSASGPYVVHTLPPSTLMAAIVIESKLDLSSLSLRNTFSHFKKNIKFNSLLISILLLSLSLNFWSLHSIEDKMSLDDQKEIANYIIENTEENEVILVYHYSPVHYYLSDRDPPHVDFRVLNIGPQFLTEERLEELLNSIKESDVRYLIVYKNMLEPDSLIDEKYPLTAELKEFFLSNYDLEEDGFQRFDIFYRESNEWA